MKKEFDCVEMKWKAQKRIYTETRGMTTEEQIEYFHKGAERFWRELKARKQRTKKTRPRHTKKSH